MKILNRDVPDVKNPLTEKGKTEIVTSSFKEHVNHHLFQQRWAIQCSHLPVDVWQQQWLNSGERQEIAGKQFCGMALPVWVIFWRSKWFLSIQKLQDFYQWTSRLSVLWPTSASEFSLWATSWIPATTLGRGPEAQQQSHISSAMTMSISWNFHCSRTLQRCAHG